MHNNHSGCDGQRKTCISHVCRPPWANPTIGSSVRTVDRGPSSWSRRVRCRILSVGQTSALFSHGSSPQGGVVCQSISVLRGSDKKLEAGKQSQMFHTYRNFSFGDQTILANLPSAMYICETVRHTSSWHWQGEKLVIVRYSTNSTELVLEMTHSPPHTPSRLEIHIRSRGRAPQPTHIQTTLISPAPPTRTAIRHPCPVPGAPTPACDCEYIRPRVPGLGSREARCGNAAATSRLRLQLVALGPYVP